MPFFGFCPFSIKPAASLQSFYTSDEAGREEADQVLRRRYASGTGLRAGSDKGSPLRTRAEETLTPGMRQLIPEVVIHTPSVLLSDWLAGLSGCRPGREFEGAFGLELEIERQRALQPSGMSVHQVGREGPFLDSSDHGVVQDRIAPGDGDVLHFAVHTHSQFDDHLPAHTKLTGGSRILRLLMEEGRLANGRAG